ncbi:hypothetical protein LOK49_LG13G02015, partial [Camellia lanceoleosa]
MLVDVSTSKKEVAEGVDLMVVFILENQRGLAQMKNGDEIGFNTEVYVTYEIDRIAHVAFETARKRCRKLCSVYKANVLEASMLWRQRVMAISSEYPDVELSHMYVHNAAMQLVRNPKRKTNSIMNLEIWDRAVRSSVGLPARAETSYFLPGQLAGVEGAAPRRVLILLPQDAACLSARLVTAAMLLRVHLAKPTSQPSALHNASDDTLPRQLCRCLCRIRYASILSREF